MKRTLITTLLGSVLVATGCNMQRMSLNMTAPLLARAEAAMESESDYELAAAALPASIKTVEGFLQTGPDNQDLLLLLAKSYVAFATLFLEDELERVEAGSEAADHLRSRAREMYMRSHDYALRLLEEQESGFREAFEKGGEALEEALAECDEDHVAGLLFAGMALGSAINLSRDDPGMIYRIPKAQALVKRVIELDEGYYNAGGHLVMGVMLGGLPKMLGGKHKKAKEHFERALKLTDRKALLIHVMYAQFLAVQIQDKKLFKKLLDEVVKADVEINPKQKLITVASKRRAKRLLARMDELF